MLILILVEIPGQAPVCHIIAFGSHVVHLLSLRGAIPVALDGIAACQDPLHAAALHAEALPRGLCRPALLLQLLPPCALQAQPEPLSGNPPCLYCLCRP